MKTSMLRSDDPLKTAHIISVAPLTIAVFNYFMRNLIYCIQKCWMEQEEY